MRIIPNTKPQSIQVTSCFVKRSGVWVGGFPASINCAQVPERITASCETYKRPSHGVHLLYKTSATRYWEAHTVSSKDTFIDLPCWASLQQCFCKFMLLRLWQTSCWIAPYTGSSTDQVPRVLSPLGHANAWRPLLQMDPRSSAILGQQTPFPSARSLHGTLLVKRRSTCGPSMLQDVLYPLVQCLRLPHAAIYGLPDIPSVCQNKEQPTFPCCKTHPPLQLEPSCPAGRTVLSWFLPCNMFHAHCMVGLQ